MPADKEYVRFADAQLRQSRSFSHMFASLASFPSVEISLEIYGMGYRTLLPTWNYPLHEHQSFEINYVTEGKQMFTINGIEHAQRAGEVVLVRPGDVHCSRAGEDEQGRKQGFSCFLLHFFLEDKVVVPFLKRSNRLFHPADSPVSQGLAPILQRLVKGASDRKEWTLSEQMQMRLDFFNILNALAIGLASQISDHSAQLAQRIAEKIEHMVSERFDGNWADDSAAGKGIQQIAADLDISVSHCYKIFKSVYQMSPRRYVSQKILDEARRLLRNPHLSIEEIAYRMKYHDPAHFSRQFKRWTGLYPGEYRLVLRSN